MQSSGMAVARVGAGLVGSLALAALASRRRRQPKAGMAALKDFGLPRLLRTGVVMTVPPLWGEIALLHFRGSFHNRFMWLPVIGLPAVFLSGAVSAIIRDERRSRAIFRPFAWVMTLVGAAGAFFHLRGAARQMGGLRNWKYNVLTGPPIPAPPQVALFGLLAALASAPPQRGETAHLLRWVCSANAASALLLAVEAGYNHWLGGFYNKVMFTPLVLSPLLAATQLAALTRPRPIRPLATSLSAAAAVAGMVGFGFHLKNISARPGGFTWQNLFYGPPIVAPLQLTAQGVIGLLAAAFEERE
jgi:hypothetical protein